MLRRKTSTKDARKNNCHERHGLEVASGVGAKLFADDAADAPRRLADGPTSGLVHGLFVLDRDATRWERVDIQTPDFRRVDVAARSYGPPIRDMCVNAERTGVVVTGSRAPYQNLCVKLLITTTQRSLVLRLHVVQAEVARLLVRNEQLEHRVRAVFPPAERRTRGVPTPRGSAH